MLAIAGITWARIETTPDPFCRTTCSEFLARITLSRSALLMFNGTGSNPLLMLWKIFLIKGKNDLGTNLSKRLPPFCVTFRRIFPCPFIDRWRVLGIRLGAILRMQMVDIHPIYRAVACLLTRNSIIFLARSRSLRSASISVALSSWYVLTMKRSAL